jgi:acyl-CoA synthetase (AMP-forming)/AMP-acid ligase II
MQKLDFINECCALGIHDQFFGETVVLAISVNSGDHKHLEIKMRDHARSNLASYQLPIKYFFYHSLPKLSSGKIDKISLRNVLNTENQNLSLKIAALLSK